MAWLSCLQVHLHWPCMDISATPMWSGEMKGARLRHEGTSQGTLMVFTHYFSFPLGPHWCQGQMKHFPCSVYCGKKSSSSGAVLLWCTCSASCFQVNICEETAFLGSVLHYRKLRKLKTKKLLHPMTGSSCIPYWSLSPPIIFNCAFKPPAEVVYNLHINLFQYGFYKFVRGHDGATRRPDLKTDRQSNDCLCIPILILISYVTYGKLPKHSGSHYLHL